MTVTENSVGEWKGERRNITLRLIPQRNIKLDIWQKKGFFAQYRSRNLWEKSLSLYKFGLQAYTIEDLQTSPLLNTKH